MKLTAFMTAFKFRKTDEEKEKMVLEHIKNEYVPFEKKIAVAQAIVDNSFWETVVERDGTEDKKLYVNSVTKYMLTCISMIDLYTDIERQKNSGNILDDFNVLNSSGVFDLVIHNINDRELKEFNMVIQMMCDDLITNEFENHAFISKQVKRFGDLVGTTLLPVISKLDLSKIDEIIKQIG